MVFKRSADAPTKQRTGINKLIVGFASVAAAAVIGTTGVAAAQTVQNNNRPQTGSGYGNTANIDVGVDVHGSNNVINIIIRTIFN